MVDYENLTQEELATLCKWIGEKAFKNVFEKNQRTLVRIYRDCRVKKLEMAQICDIVYRNRADKFIVNLLDDFSRQLLSISKKLTEEKIASGSNTETALIEVLAESPFHENIPLYFKLRDEEYSEDFIRMTTAAVAIMIRQAESTAEQGAEPDSEPTVNNDLRSEYEEQNRRIAELEQQLDTSRSETEQAKTALSAYQEKEKRLHQARRIVEDYDNPDYQHLSICRFSARRASENQPPLHRLADVIDGIIVPFECNPFEARIYDNREWLYKMGGQERDNFFGAWNWSASENRNDPSTDYIESTFNTDCIPIEIIEALDCSTCEELLDSLRNGVANDLIYDRFLWSYKTEKGYVGLLVERKFFLAQGDKLVISSDIIELPVYMIQFDDVVTLGSKNKKFLRQIDPGIPDDLVKLYDPIDLMRKMLIERASWSASRTSGVTRSQWQQSRSFLEKMPIEGLLVEFCGKCGCSMDDAQKYLSTLISQADQYLDGQDLPTATLIHAIQSSEKLSEYCAGLIRDDWEKKHFHEMNEAQQALKQLQGEVLSEKAQLIDVRSRKAAIETELREKEALAEGVEKRIADRIAAAKQDAAQFISDMAFCSTTAVSQQINTSVVSDGIQAEVDRTIVLENPDDLLDHMQYELGAAGVDDEYSLHLAAFLYSAYCNKTPLLLAGPNAAQIANAFAVCMTGMTAAAVDCNQDYAANWTDDIAAQHTDILVFRNPFRHDWIHPILEQLETPDRFYILLHPFAEDLCIEPAGLMNYVLPVLTEAFVTGKATGNYTGAGFSESFAHYQPIKPDIRLHSAELKKLVSHSILRSNIQQILTDAHKLVPEMNDDMDMLLGLIPAAYILGKGDTLLSVLEDSSSDTKQSQRFLRAIMGKDE
ncbi:MAG: hypothetical protein IKG82_00300 [Oscillospiraceae bacterium]|nr:hypothetical protein [Oscillospiraceae bacterium]MBR3417116.1 hypothetical protein [Oscillospiraceae bacterium]